MWEHVETDIDADVDIVYRAYVLLRTLRNWISIIMEM